MEKITVHSGGIGFCPIDQRKIQSRKKLIPKYRNANRTVSWTGFCRRIPELSSFLIESKLIQNSRPGRL
jgi:hypothetical protein